MASRNDPSNGLVGCGYSIIMADKHIGEKTEHLKMKCNWMMTLLDVPRVPPVRPDPEIDDRTLKKPEYDRPIAFVTNDEDVLKEITENKIPRKIYIISSGTIALALIPKILEEKITIHGYYIFCGKMGDYVDFVVNYGKKGIHILTFDDENDLIIRIGRDMCREFTEQGKRLLNLGYGFSAVKYLEYALSLGNKAYELDKEKNFEENGSPSSDYKRELLGENGLISQARQLQRRQE